MRRSGFEFVRRFIFEGMSFVGVPCTYCGAPSRDREHVYPRSLIEDMRLAGTPMEEIVVPACHECNLLASDAVFETVGEKRHYIHRQLERRYQDVLAMPCWSKEDLRGMKGRLKRWILGHMTLKKVLQERLAWEGAPAQAAVPPLCDTALGNVFAVNGAERSTTATDSRRLCDVREKTASSPTKKCATCKKEFRPRRKDSPYCSDRCEVEADDFNVSAIQEELEAMGLARPPRMSPYQEAKLKREGGKRL